MFEAVTLKQFKPSPVFESTHTSIEDLRREAIGALHSGVIPDEEVDNYLANRNARKARADAARAFFVAYYGAQITALGPHVPIRMDKDVVDTFDEERKKRVLDAFNRVAYTPIPNAHRFPVLATPKRYLKPRVLALIAAIAFTAAAFFTPTPLGYVALVAGGVTTGIFSLLTGAALRDRRIL